MDPIYLDYNATTPIDREVAETMQPYLAGYFGNPSSIHAYGIEAKQAVMKARQQVADLLNAGPEEIVFTSGGTESNNYAIKGAAFANRHKGNHLITSGVEHPAVIEVCRYLEKNGFRITWLDVDEFGLVDVNAVEQAITDETILISIMHANNEVGTIQPIPEIGRIARKKKILFHTDAAQSVGKIPVDVAELQVDLLSVAGHKLYAPKGIGALYIRAGTRLDKLIHGADHEMNQRAGTENVLEIVGLGKASEIAAESLVEHASNMREQRDALHDGIVGHWPQARLNGHPTKRLPNTLSLSFPGVEANTMLSELTEVAASAGAACHTDAIDVSGVLTAMQVPLEYAMGTIRFSTGRHTTAKEIEDAIQHVIRVVRKLSGQAEQGEAARIPAGEVKLTQFTHGMGCACKIRPQFLEQILKDLPVPTDPNVLVSLGSSDDAAVYRINDEKAIIQTVDFFTPIVDDPYQFGAIAAANALSDIYAMGGKPLFALNIVGFPDNRLPAEVLQAILRGAGDKAREAGIHILGGHTVEDPEPKFGMSVTGTVHPEKIVKNDTLQTGDVLILTKPLGTGIIATAMKRGLADNTTRDAAIRSMAELNAVAAEVMAEFHVSACTDITGFGLLGHLVEMIKQEGMVVRLNMNAIPFLPGAAGFAANGIVPGGTINNMAFTESFIDYGQTISEVQKLLVNDAQTSGGLLIALPADQEKELLERLKEKGIGTAACIGTAVTKGIAKIFLDA
jgi:cysteine desulfurase NifS/selenium donor protein